MSGKLTILGCGGSAGVPSIGNNWGACDPNNHKNRRTRCSVLVESVTTKILIDAGPDVSAQLTRANVSHLDAVWYTHFHGDHINGLEDLRGLYKRGGPTLPLFADPATRKRLETRFSNMFQDNDKTGFYPLAVHFEPWADRIAQGDISAQIVPMMHGSIMAYGYRMGDLAYCTDLSSMPEDSYRILDGVKTLIIDCNDMFTDDTEFLKQNPHVVFPHANFETIRKICEHVNADDVILTHLKNNSDYETTMAQLPDGYRLAYDGLEIAFQPF